MLLLADVVPPVGGQQAIRVRTLCDAAYVGVQVPVRDQLLIRLHGPVFRSIGVIAHQHREVGGMSRAVDALVVEDALPQHVDVAIEIERFHAATRLTSADVGSRTLACASAHE